MSDKRHADLPAVDTPRWRSFTGKRVVVHVPDGSYAARRGATELREADRAAEILEKLLQPPHDKRPGRFAIYLADHVPGEDLDVSSSETDRIIRRVAPETPGEPVSQAITRLVLVRWFGVGTDGAGPIPAGLAGVVAARAGSGPPIKEADDWVRAEITRGETVSLFAPKAGTSPAPDNRAATSFVNYLIETFGLQNLRAYLAAFDESKRDQAALDVYHRPLGTLEEAWLAEMSRRNGGTSAFREFFPRIMPLIRPYMGRQLEVFAYLGFTLAYGLAMPLANKLLIDTIIPSGNFNNLLTFVAVIFGLYVLNSLIGMRRTYLNSWINQSILVGLQQKMFSHLQRLSHNYYGKAKIGDIMTRLTSDLQIVQGAMSAVVNSGIYMIVSAIAAGAVMLLLSPVLGAIVLVVLPLFVFTYLALRTRLQKAAYDRQKISGEMSGIVQENLSAHAIIKALGLENRAVQIFQARLASLFRAGLRLVMISSLFSTSTDLAITLGQVFVLGVGGYLVMVGDITVGTLLAFMGYLPSVFGPVGALAGLGQTVQTALASLERVNDLVDEPVEVEAKSGAIKLPPLSAEIRFDRVSFAYGGERAILQNLDLTVPAGGNVAIVGPSGSGKSTIVNLLMRFWDPEQGSVRFDGHDLRDITLSSLREQIGLVFQDTFIFDTTLRENIGLSLPGATDSQIEAAARAARLESYVQSLPAGYDTVLGERGVRMSGGQRQRLAIARALLRDPAVLILDEATSALDAHTEREILDTLASVVKGRTTVTITHRLALAAAADLIYVLDQGILVEQGTHDQLISLRGLYSRLYEEQTGHSTTGRSRVGVEAARLRTIPLFARLNSEALASLAERLMTERYAPGEDVVVQGDAGDKLYIVGRGQVDIIVGHPPGQQIVNSLNDGDYFGEMALMFGEPRTATVRTTMPTELYSLSHWDFSALLQRDPAVRAAISETIANRRAALSAATSASHPALTSAVPVN